jgi:hypothetical protein
MQYKNSLSFLLSGTNQLQKMFGNPGERLFQIGVTIPVEELTEKDAGKLITEPVEDLFTYSTPARKRLYELTHGHPYFLQSICHQIFTLLQNRKLSVCSMAELDEAVGTVLTQGGTVFYSQYGEIQGTPERGLAGRAIAELNSEDRNSPITLNAIIARIELFDGRTLPPDAVRLAIDELTGLGVINQSVEGPAFRAPLMGMYIRSRHKRYAWLA